MIVLRRSFKPVVMARMSSRPTGASTRQHVAVRQPQGRQIEPAQEPNEEQALSERTSFFESSYELHSGLEVSESTWSEALDVCPDSGWPPLPPSRSRQSR